VDLDDRRVDDAAVRAAPDEGRALALVGVGVVARVLVARLADAVAALAVLEDHAQHVAAQEVLEGLQVQQAVPQVARGVLRRRLREAVERVADRVELEALRALDVPLERDDRHEDDDVEHEDREVRVGREHVRVVAEPPQDAPPDLVREEGRVGLARLERRAPAARREVDLAAVYLVDKLREVGALLVEDAVGPSEAHGDRVARDRVAPTAERVLVLRGDLLPHARRQLERFELFEDEARRGGPGEARGEGRGGAFDVCLC